MISNQGRTTELSEIDRPHIARKNTTRRYEDRTRGSKVLRIAFFCENGASRFLSCRLHNPERRQRTHCSQTLRTEWASSTLQFRTPQLPAPFDGTNFVGLDSGEPHSAILTGAGDQKSWRPTLRHAQARLWTAFHLKTLSTFRTRLWGDSLHHLGEPGCVAPTGCLDLPASLQVVRGSHGGEGTETKVELEDGRNESSFRVPS